MCYLTISLQLQSWPKFIMKVYVFLKQNIKLITHFNIIGHFAYNPLSRDPSRNLSLIELFRFS